MKVYTYCSFKASSAGYQYALVDLNKCDNRSGKQECSLEFVKKWFENRDDWRLVLKRKKNDPEKACLLIASLESAIAEMNRKRRKEREEIEEANRFRANKKSLDSSDLQMMDPDLYVNIALVGNLDELYAITIGVLSEFQNDAGNGLYEQLSACIINEKNMNYYSVDGSRLSSMLGSLSQKGKTLIDQNADSNDKKSGNLKKIMTKNSSDLCIRRQGSDKKEDIISLIRGLPDPHGYLSKNMIYVAEDEELDKYGFFNFAISYDFLIKGY